MTFLGCSQVSVQLHPPPTASLWPSFVNVCPMSHDSALLSLPCCYGTGMAVVYSLTLSKIDDCTPHFRRWSTPPPQLSSASHRRDHQHLSVPQYCHHQSLIAVIIINSTVFLGVINGLAIEYSSRSQDRHYQSQSSYFCHCCQSADCC